MCVLHCVVRTSFSTRRLFSFHVFLGTSERVCLITGNVEAILAVMEFISEKIREKPDLTTKTTVDFDSGKATAERDKQVSLGFL